MILPAVGYFQKSVGILKGSFQNKGYGFIEYKENEDPIGVNRANDYTANIPDAVRKQYENAKLPAAGERVAIVDPNAFIY